MEGSANGGAKAAEAAKPVDQILKGNTGLCEHANCGRSEVAHINRPGSDGRLLVNACPP
jgi:hypothetical protein